MNLVYIMATRKLFQSQLRSYMTSSIAVRFSFDQRPSWILGNPSYVSHNDCLRMNLRNYAARDSRASMKPGSVFQRNVGHLTLSSSDRDEDPNEDSILTNQIRTATSFQNVLEQIEATELKLIKLKDISTAIRRLFDFIKMETSPTSTVKHDILNSVGMQKLSKVIRYQARFMNEGDLINTTKLFVLLNTPGVHLTFQIVLKMLTKKVNSLELSQIVYLQFLLSKLKDTKSALAEALEVALPIVFESQLNLQLDTNDIQRLCDYLHFASKCDLADSAVKVLVEALLKHNPQNISPTQYLSIIWSLCDMKRNYDYQEDLANVAFRQLANNIEVLRPSEVTTTVQKSCVKYLKRWKWFYQEDFIDSVCNRHVGKNNPPLDTLHLFKKVSLMRHVNVELMDRVADIISTDGSSLLKDNKRLFFSLIRCFSNCNYKPEKWRKMEEMLLDPDLTTDSLAGDIELSVNILTMDMFPEALITKLFSPENIPNLEDFMERNIYPVPLIILSNAVNLLYKDYSGPRLPHTFFDEVEMKKDKRVSLPLKNSLISAFGGESYVLNEIVYSGLYIDHAIVLRKGGYPVAVNCESNGPTDLHSINEAAVPESLIVLVKIFFKEAYANNTSRLRGIHGLEQKVLEAIGHPIVFINANNWTELSDYEKIPFLMHQIKEKVEKFQWNRNGDVIPS